MKILMVASEAVPFAKTGGLGDVVGSLPAALRSLGHQVAVLNIGMRPHDHDVSIANHGINH